MKRWPLPAKNTSKFSTPVRGYSVEELRSRFTLRDARGSFRLSDLTQANHLECITKYGADLPRAGRALEAFTGEMMKLESEGRIYLSPLRDPAVIEAIRRPRRRPA